MECEVGRFCVGMSKNPSNGRTLVMHGENGTGKTHCAMAIHAWVQAVGHAFQWMAEPNRIANLESRFWRWPALLDALKGGGWDLVDGCIETPCLILDELGGGYDPNRIGVDKLCQILSRREYKWTVITTNIRPNAWENEFDRRVASRLFRNSIVIDLSKVPDYATIK